MTYRSASLAILSALWLATTSTTVQARDSFETSFNKPFTASFSRLDHAACVSLFYRDGRIGCGTEDRSVQIGRLEYFDGDLPQVDDAYVAVMEEFMLNEASFKTLAYGQQNSGGKLQGVLVLNSTNYEGSEDASYRSPDAIYPQGSNTPSQGVNYGYYAYPWNANGENLLAYNFHGLPMAFVKDSDVADTLRGTAKDSSQDSGIVAEFNYYMGPEDIDSAQCLAWTDDASGEWNPKCLPLGGTSVWATAGPAPSYGSSNQAKPVVVVGAGIDGTGLFHDLVPGANTAASNILTLLMAAKLVGESVDDDVLANLNNQIVFGFFQGESYGFLGSRNFFRDVAYPGFSCNSNVVRAVPNRGEDSPMACLNPLHPNLDFMQLGQINGMISVDQIGVATTTNLLYVHSDQDNDNYGNFLANVMMQSGTSSMTVVASSAEASNAYGYPYPPTPLTSLLALSEGAAGGAVLSGYDYAYANRAPYHSHRDSEDYISMNLKSIAAAATIVARSAIAAAYDGGDYDYETAAAYALNLIPNGASYDDDVLVEMAECFYDNGQCALINKYASIQASNMNSLTGVSFDRGESLGVPPNYYVSVFSGLYGQPIAYVGDKSYGAYDGEEFGNHGSDTISQQPRAVTNAIYGLLNDFLGRSSVNFEEVSCRRVNDCDSAGFCDAYNEKATCSGGGLCVCDRARYHSALDEAIKPAVGKTTGYFEFDEYDAGISPVYTEPNWSVSVGVRVYRDVGPLPGLVTLAVGAVVMALSVCSTFVLRVGLKKEKLY
jgi:nicastrin